MPYVSARYMPPDPMAPPDAPRPVQATDTEGLVWSFFEDSQVGDWLRYIEDGGTIEAAPEPTTEPAPQPTPEPPLETVPQAEPPVVYGEPVPE